MDERAAGLTGSGGQADQVTHQEIIDRMPLLAFLDLRVVTPPAPDVHSITMDVGSKVRNLAGNPHGGAIATLIDHTGGHAAGVLCGRAGPTVDLHIRYLSTPSSSSRWVRADARILREGRRFIVVGIEVRDEDERLLATGSMTVAPHRNTTESPD